MTGNYSLINKSFSKRIEQSNWQQHLDSHYLFISDLKQFLEQFNISLFADRFIGFLRFRCFQMTGPKSIIEQLKIDFQTPENFIVKITFNGSGKVIVEEYTFTVANILAWQISSQPILQTERIEIGLLLPSEEPDIIDFMKDPDVWKMRGETYRPIANIHSIFESNNKENCWYKYHFAVRMRQSKKTIGFISFYQISKPSLISPIISQTPYEAVMLSYALSKNYWGKGLMSESLSAFVPLFVETQKIRELIAFADSNNRASRRVLQKLGLQEYGLLENPNITEELKDRYNFIIFKN